MCGFAICAGYVRIAPSAFKRRPLVAAAFVPTVFDCLDRRCTAGPAQRSAPRRLAAARRIAPLLAFDCDLRLAADFADAALGCGQILLGGEDITHLPAHARVGRGLSRTFQINQLFGDFTPLESMMLAISEREGHGWRAWRPLSGDREVADEAAHLLERFRLVDTMGTATTLLPYGKQRLLEIALAIASRPRVLLLDEPAAGVPEEERHEVLSIVRDLPPDVTVVLIEHDMDLVFSFADRISVLAAGSLFAEGTVEEISKDRQVKAIYLGEDA